ncbi:MAG: 4-hydroxy-tetrahydrodipicolinate reductase [Verrucomicrobia bacterium]|nr:4-hydroxy-tetrahydrodipicolinate reductase [Verrucomicrobiota bacterium]
MTSLLVHGAAGRLGSRIIRAARATPGLEVREAGRNTDLSKVLPGCDAAIDVSQPGGTVRLVAAAVVTGTPVVIGTTGHSAEELEGFREAARRLPILAAPNFSIGVNLLFWLTQRAAESLGQEFRAEILELHHELKKDAPSGTAQKLGELVARARGQNYGEVVRHGRRGLTGERRPDELGMHAVRGGDITGEHTVYLIGPGERLELTHRATSRDIFARGALRAAHWLAGRPPGWYEMADALDLPR